MRSPESDKAALWAAFLFMDFRHAEVEMCKNEANRAGDTSQRCGNSPAVYVSRHFTPKSEPPEVLSKSELLTRLSDMGFDDTDTPQASYFIDRVGYSHARPYAARFAHRCTGLATVEAAVRFDRLFQSVMLKYIGIFEVQFRAQYSRLLAESGGAFAHRDPSCFKSMKWFESSLSAYAEEANRQIRQKNEHVRSGVETYGDLPVWDAVEVMSMGTLSKLYKNTRSKRVRFGVADSFDVTYEDLVSWMGTISFVRNRCAHFGRLLGTNLVYMPRAIDGVALSTRHPLYAALVLEKLLSSEVEFPNNIPLMHSVCLLSDIVDAASECTEPIVSEYFPPNWKRLISRADIVGVDVAVGTVASSRPSRIRAEINEGA